MLKLKDIYTLPGIPRPLTAWVIQDRWFPEIECGTLADSAVLEALEAEGRVEVRELANPYIDGYRIAQMHTVWFDQQPVFIAQDAGRGGDDYRKRWVTDATRYFELVAYLLSKSVLNSKPDDLVDGEKLVYEEEVLCFYGQDLRAKFGYAVEPTTPGYCLMPHATSIVPGCDTDQVLAMLEKSVEAPAPYIRRAECVLAYERALTEAELASNPRLTLSLEGTAYDRYVWYRPCERPVDAVVLSV